ncbi:ExbD/TolR family protein [Allohahella marinimesophila]|uniref:Biopolymer transporter ExbD n=1 Tax=Allohahella marinimesophila TaxID=1054972 RepID=A0ABP7PBL4_9GAMM
MLAPFSAPAKLAAKQARRKTVISLTPLIDVVFILLVFFMLASSFLDWRVLSMDTSAAGPAAPTDLEDFVVRVQGDDVLVDGAAVSLDQLTLQLTARQPADQPVSLLALGDTTVQQVVRVLDRLDAAGIQPLKVVDDPSWSASGSGAPADALP